MADRNGDDWRSCWSRVGSCFRTFVGTFVATVVNVAIGDEATVRVAVRLLLVLGGYVVPCVVNHIVFAVMRRMGVPASPWAVFLLAIAEGVALFYGLVLIVLYEIDRGSPPRDGGARPSVGPDKGWPVDHVDVDSAATTATHGQRIATGGGSSDPHGGES